MLHTTHTVVASVPSVSRSARVASSLLAAVAVPLLALVAGCSASVKAAPVSAPMSSVVEPEVRLFSAASTARPVCDRHAPATDVAALRAAPRCDRDGVTERAMAWSYFGARQDRPMSRPSRMATRDLRTHR